MASQPAKSTALRIFISYSRTDLGFANMLATALRVSGHDPIIDSADIAPNDEWRDRLNRLILEVDAVVFILSPAWAKSDVCRWEFRRSLELRKLFVPIMWKSLNIETLPKELSARNFVFFNAKRPFWRSKLRAFEGNFRNLIAGLEIADEQWRRSLSRYMARATDWRENGFSEDHLLSRGETTEAQSWAASKPAEEDELPALLIEFFSASATAHSKLTSIESEVLGGLDLIQGFHELPIDQVRRLPTALVVADYGIIPYDDGRGLKSDLLSWATDRSKSGPVGRLYAAGGGYGKTRLALEVVTALRAAGWHGGMVPRAALEKTGIRGEHDADARLKRFFDARGERGALLVLDYAEGRVGQIERITKAALTAPKGGPIRIVLLARSAGEWWDDLLAESRDIQLLFEQSSLSGIGSDIARDGRHNFFQTAAVAFAQVLAAAQARDDPLLGRSWDTRPIPARRLAAPEVGSPLSLAFEAFLHVRGVQAESSPLAEMAREEKRHWARALKIKASDTARMGDLRVGAVHRCAATLTLTRGTPVASALTTDKALDRVLEIALSDAPLPSDGGDIAKAQFLGEVRSAVERLYLDRDQRGTSLRPILPDLLGEHLVGAGLAQFGNGIVSRVLDQDDKLETALTVIDRLSRRQTHPDHADAVRLLVREALWPRLPRMVEPFVSVAKRGVGDLSFYLSDMVQTALPVEVKALLPIILIERSLSLGPFVSALKRRMSEGLPVIKLAGSSGTTKAAFTSLAGDGLLEQGDFGAAIRKYEEARLLLKNQLRDYGYYECAGLLQANLATAQGELGRLDDAKVTVVEAISVIKEGMERLRLPDQAQGLRKRLIEAYTRWISILCKRNDQEFEAALAEVTKWFGQATPKSELEIFSLATIAHNAGSHYFMHNKEQQALEYFTRSLTLKRQLVKLDEDKNGPDLASTLLMVSQIEEAGEPNSRHALACEAANILHSAVSRDPERYADLYARALGAKLKIEVDLSREERFETSRQALDAWRRILQELNHSYLAAEGAQTLRLAAAVQLALEQFAVAELAAQLAIQGYQQVVPIDDSVTSGLDTARRLLILCLEAQNRGREAAPLKRLIGVAANWGEDIRNHISHGGAQQRDPPPPDDPVLPQELMAAVARRIEEARQRGETVDPNEIILEYLAPRPMKCLRCHQKVVVIGAGELTACPECGGSLEDDPA